MKITNVHKLPEPLVTLARKNFYTKGKSRFSATELLQPPRVRRLMEKFDDQIESDVADQMWSLIGSALHVVMERGKTDGWITEERLFAEIGGVSISGQIDIQQETPEGIIIWDYKFTKAWAVMRNKKTWEDQLNIYKWFVETVKRKKVIGLKICAFVRDWNTYSTSEDYPPAPTTVIDVAMQSSVDTENMMRRLIDMHQNSKVAADFEEELPLCSDEDKWMSQTMYAVRRDGRKTAIRVFPTEAEAIVLAEKEKGYVEKRSGEPRRCLGNFCQVAKFCEQFKQQHGELLSAETSVVGLA